VVFRRAAIDRHRSFGQRLWRLPVAKSVPYLRKKEIGHRIPRVVMYSRFDNDSGSLPVARLDQLFGQSLSLAGSDRPKADQRSNTRDVVHIAAHYGHI
jgi:hypothetical protein